MTMTTATIPTHRVGHSSAASPGQYPKGMSSLCR